MSFVSTDGIHWYVSADGITAAVWPAFCFTCRGRGVHSSQCGPEYLSHRQGVPVCLSEIHNLTEPLSRHGVYLRLQTGGSVFPVKTWPAGKLTVSAQSPADGG